MQEKRDSLDTQIAVIANNIEYIKTDIIEIKNKLEGEYVTKAEFDPIKRIVYGVVGLILAGVASVILAGVLK